MSNVTLLAQATPVLNLPEVSWQGISPLLVVAGAAVLMLTVASVTRGRLPEWVWPTLASLTGLVGLGFVIWQWNEVGDSGPYLTLANAVAIDRFSLFLVGVICVVVVLVPMLAAEFLEREQMSALEFYVLMLLSASGGIVMCGANDLIVMFLGIEILSIAVYVMAAMQLTRLQSQEAGMKYFILGAFASAFLLYGIAMVYGATGSTNLSVASVRAAEISVGNVSDGVLLAGFALMLVGLAFKVGAVPFHQWTPDVYEGAPSPAVAFMASAVKVAAFAAIIRIFSLSFYVDSEVWRPVIIVLAVLSMVIGSIVAIIQTNVKRMLAYSSISHAGFMLLGVAAVSGAGLAGTIFYSAAYAVIVVGSFALVTIEGLDGDRRQELSDYRGFAKHRPMAALLFAVLLFAQAGVPFTTGFLAKSYVIAATLDRGDYWLGVLAMVASVVAAFIYLRIVLSMYSDDEAEVPGEVPYPLAARVALVAAVAFTVGFGIFPAPLDEIVTSALPFVP